MLNDALSAVLEESFMNWVRHAKDKEDNDDNSNEDEDALSRGR